jgi:ArsR family transcriptional regulator
MEMKNALAALTALSHATRLAVFRRLFQAGPYGCNAGDIAGELQVPTATLSFHLKELSHAGLIEGETRGRFVCYRANFSRMTELLGYLTENCCAGSPLTTCSPDVSCPPRQSA